MDDDLITGTDLALEDLTQPQRWVQVAGLQFYDYWCEDDLVGRVAPGFGDRLGLVRQPDNRADRRAIEVWWRNGYKLGHLPREDAAEIAAKLDAGLALRAYCLSPGNGQPWSLRVLLVGPACELPPEEPDDSFVEADDDIPF